MRLTHLQADGLKSLRNVDIEIAKLFAVSGENGSGKTALSQAVKVGVLGYDPTIGKRLLDTRTELAADGEELEVALTFDAGFGIRRKIGKSMVIRVAPSNGERTDAELQARIDEELGGFLLPLDLKSFTALTPEKRKEWLFEQLPRGRGELDVDYFRRFLAYTEVDPVTQRAIDHLWAEHVVTNARPIDGLGVAIGVAHKKLLETEQSRLAQVNVVTAADQDALAASKHAAAYDPETASELQAELSAVEQQIGELREQQEAAARAAAALRERDHQQQMLEARERAAAAACRQAAEELQLLRAAPAADLAALRAEAERSATKARSQREAVAYTAGEAERLREAVRAQTAVQRMAERRLAELDELDACPTCGSAETLDAARAQLRAEMEIRNAEVADLTASLERAVADAAEAEATQRGYDQAEAAARRAVDVALQAASSLERAERELERQQQARQSFENELIRLKHVPLPIAPSDIADPRPHQERAVQLREQLREQQELTKQAGKAEGERERATRERAKLEDLEGRVDRLKGLHRGLQKLRAQIIQQLVEPVESHAQEILAKIDPAKTFRFVFEREGRPACDFGFEERGTFRSFKAASGGEQALLAIVFIAAMMDTVQPAWRVLMIDAAEAIDRRRRRALMEAIAQLSDHFDNVLINGCCEFDVLDGWQVIDAAELTVPQAAAA